ncbi:hypothetical protein [Chryseobacterium fistulae]|uniref:Uncharacterized protein n=1 Tax=Chryseobacterium fistulae TaxID=2675058 RepID=A0A6N4XQN4_9FLAO|nr:hypothetical protein [Chryseobacterium fistulae]CAA7386446.1 hypothetical protein CHRY9393_00741 [Chryseobacterium fistulae]
MSFYYGQIHQNGVVNLKQNELLTLNRLLWSIFQDSTLYPGAEAIRNFMQDFVNYNYKFSKGAVQFPMNADLPMDLIQKIVKFRIGEIEQNKKS